MDSEHLPHSEDVDDEMQASYMRRIRERMRVPEMIVQAYRSAWASFYAWEPQHSEHIMLNLQAPTARNPASAINDLLEVQDYDPDSTLQILTVFSADRESPPRSIDVLELSLPSLPLVELAYPKYETCTPAPRNISHDDDERLLRFIPYADEPGFYFQLYARQHESFVWQTSWYDVDYKLIALHAVWSLHANGVLPMLVDDYQIPFVPSITGLLTTLCCRDLIHWGTTVPIEQLTLLRGTYQNMMRNPVPNIWRSVNSLNSIFCRSTNCVEGLCMLHKSSKPPVRHTKHRKANEDYMESTRPCSPKCYRTEQNLDTDVMEINQDICDMLKVFPDSPICKLAIICKADCCDVYYHRMMYLPERISSIPEEGKIHHVVLQADTTQHWTDICDHDGPCVPPACICALRQTECNRRCHCFALCNTHRGCTCEDGKCVTTGDIDCMCSCYVAGWECSPELCASIRNKRTKKHTKHSCKNMYLQKNKKPDIVVKQATYGLGSFASSKITTGTYLGEYIAEKYLLPLDHKSHTRIEKAQRKVNRHRTLNYMFTLDDNSAVLDAATVGDPTRCLNDSYDKGKLNVKAESIIVDGDARIYFWAFKDVKKDEELLLSYGEAYWKNCYVASSDEDRYDARALDSPDDEGNDEVEGEDSHAFNDGEKADG